ncbi:uncharacterized protein P884DRAFT_253538 [Thermothelomyces heterothallicus CBS 202.75]|uniref:uncharacterized protein n=1 Tax=Thermothelomyces heterothallicus CBS 202.75 TaxID=1149848 RepID=UPI00374282AF
MGSGLNTVFVVVVAAAAAVVVASLRCPVPWASGAPPWETWFRFSLWFLGRPIQLRYLSGPGGTPRCGLLHLEFLVNVLYGRRMQQPMPNLICSFREASGGLMTRPGDANFRVHKAGSGGCWPGNCRLQVLARAHT